MSNELISVVVPVYNVEQYVAKCLDSIITQTYSNIEVLIIDDGSPDNSGAICDEYVAKDSRIKVFHIPNGGVAKARQLGVERSTGEYIVFVDPDDWLPLNSIEVLYSNMNDGVDVVVGGYVKVYEYRKNNISFRSETISNDEYIRRLLSGKIYKAPWGKIFRRSCITSECFPTLKKGQDFLMNLEIGIRAKSVVIISDNVYCYFLRAESTVHTVKSTLDLKKQFYSQVESIIKSHGLHDKYCQELCYFALDEIYYLFVRGTICSYNDIWVRFIVDSSKHIKCSQNQKITCFALKHKSIQYIMYYCRNTAVILKRQLHL